MTGDTSVEVMFVEIKELGFEGLNAVVYDTRPISESTFLSGIETSEVGDEQWKQEFNEMVEDTSSFLIKYVDSEWRNVSVEYTEEGLIKEGPQLERQHIHFFVENTSSLTARIESLSDAFIIIVEADGVTKVEQTLTHEELNLEPHPELED